MISLNGRVVKLENLSQEITNSEQMTILKQMINYPAIYYYESLQQLKFELLFRANTIKAANDLDKSGVKFTTFTYSFPNRKYWYRLPNGGFLLREGINPSEGIEDIVKNAGGNISGYDVYLRGPLPMMQAFEKKFMDLGLSKNNIHYEEFNFR